MIEPPFPNRLLRASAGSGKTHQLTNRYLGLLAAGVEPETMLATTFTRKAAGEILDRVLERLAAAAAEPAKAKELAEQIEAGQGRPEEFQTLLRQVLRHLDRVRISTLDSFYNSVAGAFSLELELPAGWSICEEDEDEALREDALERLLEAEEADVLTDLYRRLTLTQSRSSVRNELLSIVAELYAIHQETAAEAWKCIAVPNSLGAQQLDALCDEIAAFDLSDNKAMTKPRDADLERARNEAWGDFLKTGLCAKVRDGTNTFYKKPIPPRLIGHYKRLIGHARTCLIRPLAEQTCATCEFLDRLQRKLQDLKQATGALRFDEVTQAVATAMGEEALAPAALAFRLDGAIEHLLLDEFQDTSLMQWRVLEPMAKRITEAPAASRRSFFCVGDVKQAIFRWRGGLAEIMERLPDVLERLEEQPLDVSRRSAPPIIDAVNKVFGSLKGLPWKEKDQPGVTAWSSRFKDHETVKKNEPGYVCLHSGPAQQETEDLCNHRGRHCQFVAEKVAQLVQETPGRSIGILCRKNDIVARMIFELRQRGIEASEEGGSPLTDSPAVELILSLLTLADHPRHSIAWFHLRHSPLAEHVAKFATADLFAQYLRRDLLTQGYGSFVLAWARQLAAACDRRDLARLQQLVELAFDYQARSTLRASAFVRFVRQKRVSDPSAAQVRVMTIHAAKGLEFDTVILPELDSSFAGKTPKFVVRRDTKSLEATFVCRYADETIQSLLTDEEQKAFAQHRQHQIEESLSLLYVAMTRAIHALYMYIPGTRLKLSDGWHTLLRQALAPDAVESECTLLYKDGNTDWCAQLPAPAVTAAKAAPERPDPIAFRATDGVPRRGLERTAPSDREGQGIVHTDKLFQTSDKTSTAAGTLYHAWFETIEWLDHGPPTDAALRAAADKLRSSLPTTIWQDWESLLARFRGWLANPTISAALRRSAYADPQQAGFPQALAPFWTPTLQPQQVERERRFLVLDDGKLWNGSFDRVVWLADGNRIEAVDVLDYKTDAVQPGDDAELAVRTEHYRPQLEAYRRALARLTELPEDRIATRLLFTVPGRVVDV